MIDWGTFGPVIGAGFGLAGTILSILFKRDTVQIKEDAKAHKEEVSRTERALVDYLLRVELHIRKCEDELAEERSIRPQLYTALNAHKDEVAENEASRMLRQNLLDVLDRRVPATPP